MYTGCFTYWQYTVTLFSISDNICTSKRIQTIISLVQVEVQEDQEGAEDGKGDEPTEINVLGEADSANKVSGPFR